MSPFGDFKDWDECMAKAEANPDVDDPKAYCGAIKHMAEHVGNKPVFLFAPVEALSLEGNVVTGVAIHPKTIWHPEEGWDWKSKHVYLKEQLKKAAGTLGGSFFGRDHIRLLADPNLCEKSWWDEEQNGIAFKGSVDDAVAKDIREKVIKGVSIEIDWDKKGPIMEKVNGIAPINFKLTNLHFLKYFPAGDKDAYVKLWESVASLGQRHPQVPSKDATTNEPTTPGQSSVQALQQGQAFNLEETLEANLLNTRTMIFHGVVKESSCKEACRRLEFLGKVSRKPIHIILNSVGGGVYDGLLVFDTIKRLSESGIEVTCEARGLAASMGSIILQAGTKRIATPHTRFLMHEVSSLQWGETTQLEERTEELRKLNTMLNGIYAERTGKTIKEIEELTKKTDYWMSVGEAKEFGLIDDIVTETMKEGILIPPAPAPYDVQIEMLRQMFEERLRFLEGKLSSLIATEPILKQPPNSPVVVVFKEAQDNIMKLIGEMRRGLDVLSNLAKKIKEQRQNKTGEDKRIAEAIRKLGKQLEPVPESVALVNLRKGLVDAQDRAKVAEDKLDTIDSRFKEKYRALHKAFVGTLPYPHIWRAWGAGPKRLIMEQMRVLGIDPNTFEG